MSYVATLLLRTGGSWLGTDLDLDDVESLDELTELVQEHAEDAESAVLLVEDDQEWYAVLRSDPGEDDARVFVSDPRAALRHALGEVLLDSAEEEDATAGEPDLLADLGLPSARVATSGPAPISDAVAEVAHGIGAGDALEAVR